MADTHAPAGGPSPERKAFYDKLRPHDAAPLWEVLRNLLTPQPRPTPVAHRWRYRDMRPLVLESGGLLTAEEAERRVLMLENPALPGQARITSTLYAGIQLILPGETAPAHRHTPSALRFVIEGEGGFTAVDGERTTMRPGDFIITPSGGWHDHGNEGDGPVIWLDGLDLPLVGFFEVCFLDHHNAARFPVSRPEGTSQARYGDGMLPLTGVARGHTSPVFNYPWARTRASLLALAAAGDPDPHHGTALRYANPTTGDWAMPTIAPWAAHLPAGFETTRYRSTDGVIAVVVEGAAEFRVGDAVLDAEPGDVVAIPNWAWRQVRARTETFLFCFSDRAAQEKLGYWREEAGA